MTATVQERAIKATQIWENENRKINTGGANRRSLFIVTGVLIVVAALTIGLYVGLKKSTKTTSSDNNEIVAQAKASSYSLGCFVDERRSRVMPHVYTDLELTPSICNDYCEKKGYYYYALQWGVECWCGPKNVDIDQHGIGICDYPCAGDSNSICGGYLAFNPYVVGSGTVCSGTIASVRFASSGIAYFEGKGCATLTDMYNVQSGKGPLYTLDEDDNVIDGGGGTPTGRWLLTMNLRVIDGVTLYIHGTSVGGDCDVLRIESTDETYHELRGYGGSLSFKSTTVTSWDTDSGTERTSYSDGRSFINCVSEETSKDKCKGAAKKNMGECRMDIIDSTMGNLGFLDSESYGLTWKVRGYCTDGSNPAVFERTGVYGDIQGSEIYGMYYGVYTYGHDGGEWTNNVMRDNIQYGFDPHDDSDNIVIANNEVYGNGNHGIIASKRCNNVEIYGNEVYDGGDQAVGIFLHRSSDDATVYDNYIHDMKDAGFAIMESMDAAIYDNKVENGRYGLRISLGGAGNQIYDNMFDGCSDATGACALDRSIPAGFYTYQGSDAPDVSDGRPSENVFTNNVVSNTPIGVKLTDGDSNEFIDNDFTGAEVFEFDDSTDTYWSGNIIGDACKDGSSSFASGSDAIPSC